MKGEKVIFENEDASRLLDYFISYKEIVNKNEITISVPKHEELIIK